MTNKGPEILHTDNENEKFKVSELKETILNDEQKENFKDVILTLEQATKLKDGKLTVEELTKLKLDQFKKVGEDSPDKLHNSFKKGIENTEEFFEKSVENISNSKAGVKTKEILKEKKEDIKKAVEKGGFVAFVEKMKNSDNPLLKFFGSFLGFFVGLFGFGKKVEDTKEKVKEKLSLEEIEKTREKTKEYILKKSGSILKEKNKEKLELSLEKLTIKQLEELNKKFEKGDIKFSDITDIAPNIFKEFLEKEQIEEIKKETKKKIIESIKKEVGNKYSVNIEGEKLKELEKLVENNIIISDESISSFIEINNQKQMKINDLFGPGFETIINSSSLLLGLLIKGIIPISSFGLDFASNSADVIKLSANALGVSKNINLNMFQKSIENLDENEKALIVALLYRKGGLLLSIIGSIGETVSRVGVEFITKTPVKTYDLVGSSLTNNYSKQIDNLDKISKSIGLNTDVNGILKEAIDNLDKVKENYKILDILSKSEGNTKVAFKLLEDAGIKDIPNKNLNFDDFVKGFKKNASLKLTDFISKGSATSAFGFGASADLFKLNQKIEAITSAQRKMFEGNFLTKGIAKLRELSNIGEISRIGDRLALHFESIEEAKKGVSKWNILANKFPDLVKGTLDKLPIIAVAGISASSDKPFFEELQKEMWYLIPIVGPIMIVGDSGFSWKNGKIESINAIEAGIGGALLTLDGVILTKEFIKGGTRGAGTYMIKPIKDIYGLARGTGEGAYSIGKAALNGKSFNQVFQKANEKAKYIKNTKLRTIAILAGLTYIGFETISADDNIKKIFHENGKMDKEKLKNEISNLSDEDKKVCLNYLISENFGEKILKDLKINIDNNKLNIISNNNSIKSDWFIDNNMLELLQLNTDYNFKYQKTA